MTSEDVKWLLFGLGAAVLAFVLANRVETLDEQESEDDIDGDADE